MKKKSVAKQIEEGLKEGIEYSKGKKDLVTSHAENNIKGWVVVTDEKRTLSGTFSTTIVGCMRNLCPPSGEATWDGFKRLGWDIVPATSTIIVKLDDENGKKKKADKK